MLIKEPGIYKNLSNELYHQSDGISSSGMGLIIPPNCPALYHYQYLSGKYIKPDSKEFVIGSAVHTLTLEPHTFAQRFAVCPKVDRRTKAGAFAYNSFIQQYAGKEFLTPEQYELAQNMAAAVNSHMMFASLYGQGNIEDSVAWIDADSGALLRTRPDFYNDSFILDVKTTKDVRIHSFQRSIIDFGYHRQGAMACDGLTQMTGIKHTNVVLFVVSKEPPHLVKAYVLRDEAIEVGRMQYKHGAQIYQQCLNENRWPGYNEIIEDVDLPRWAYSMIEEY